MANGLIHLDWFKCPDGYHLEEEPETAADKNARVVRFGDRLPGMHVVQNSNIRVPAASLGFPALYRILADTPPSPVGALSFIEKFGFLHDHRDTEDSVRMFRDAVLNMRRLLKLIDQADWQSIGRWLDRHGQENPLTTGGGLGGLGLLLDLNSEDAPRISFRPVNLRAGLFVQAIQEATISVRHGKCRAPGCSNYFRIGRSQGGLREGANYCSPKCQKAHAYAKRRGMDQ